MSFLAKRELLARVAPRYQTAAQESVILDEFLAVTGYARKHAIRLRLLAHPVPVPMPLTRPRERCYGRAVQDALVVAWTAANRICAKRLVPFLPEMVPALEWHDHLMVTDAVREQLFALSPATADRILRPYREQGAPHGMTTTRRGLLIKQQVPVRTFTGWDDVVPGFFEADLVAHCGPWAEGTFLQTLMLTDADSDESGESFGEDAPQAARIAAEEAADVQHERDREIGDREIGDMATIAAMDTA